MVKTARFLLAPVDYLASQQDRFQRYLKRVADKVDPQNLVEASPQIVGKTLESMRYLEEDSPLTEMFIKILALSVDGAKNSLVHPAFPIILSNLCRDQAVILYFLKNNIYDFVSYSKFDAHARVFTGSEVRENKFPLKALTHPDNFILYMNHLHSLNIAGIWQEGNQTPDIRAGVQVGVTIHHKIRLQEFGEKLVEACVVDDITAYGVDVESSA